MFTSPTKPLTSQQIQACHKTMGFRPDDCIDMTGTVPPNVRAELWKEKRVFYMVGRREPQIHRRLKPGPGSRTRSARSLTHASGGHPQNTRLAKARPLLRFGMPVTGGTLHVVGREPRSGPRVHSSSQKGSSVSSLCRAASCDWILFRCTTLCRPPRRSTRTCDTAGPRSTRSSSSSSTNATSERSAVLRNVCQCDPAHAPGSPYSHRPLARPSLPWRCAHEEQSRAQNPRFSTASPLPPLERPIGSPSSTSAGVLG